VDLSSTIMFFNFRWLYNVAKWLMQYYLERAGRPYPEAFLLGRVGQQAARVFRLRRRQHIGPHGSTFGWTAFGGERHESI